MTVSPTKAPVYQPLEQISGVHQVLVVYNFEDTIPLIFMARGDLAELCILAHEGYVNGYIDDEATPEERAAIEAARKLCDILMPIEAEDEDDTSSEATAENATTALIDFGDIDDSGNSVPYICRNTDEIFAVDLRLPFRADRIIITG